MQCLCSILEVARDVGDNELRGAYRRRALQTHPVTWVEQV